jgi:hypothetical protein
MAFSRQEDFPESTLNDDDHTWNKVPVKSKSKKIGNQGVENPSWRISPEGAEQGQDGSGDQGFTTPQLRPTWARPRVDIDQQSLTSIGKANSTANVNKRWNQGMEEKSRECSWTGPPTTGDTICPRSECSTTETTTPRGRSNNGTSAQESRDY